jgi:hypothetical protein
MQKNPGRGALWVKPEKALEVMMEQKRKGKALYWKDFKPVIAEQGGQRLCWLQCTKQEGVCGKLLSIQNPARSASDHFKPEACKAVRQEQGQATLSAQLGQSEKRDSSHVGGQASSSKQPRVHEYLVSAKQLQDCRNHLARFFYKGAACSASRCVLRAQ